MLFWGILSDKIGRKKVVVLGFLQVKRVSFTSLAYLAYIATLASGLSCLLPLRHL
jgi:MFS family permease